jgi:hypothetical protein
MARSGILVQLLGRLDFASGTLEKLRGRFEDETVPEKLRGRDVVDSGSLEQLRGRVVL